MVHGSVNMIARSIAHPSRGLWNQRTRESWYWRGQGNEYENQRAISQLHPFPRPADDELTSADITGHKDVIVATCT